MMKSECVVTVKRGREKPVLAGHPWIFSGAVKSIDGYGTPGDLCTVRDEKGRFLAVGYANTNSRITVRVLTLEEEEIGGAFVERSLERALRLRESLFGKTLFRGEKSAFRAVNAEGDFLPGLIVDRYGEGLVVQALTAGMQRLKGLVVAGLRELYSPAFIYEKVDTQMAGAEGMSTEMTGLAGTSPTAASESAKSLADACLHGELISPLEIEENGARFLIDIEGGQKTGFYLDQRRNRAILREISADREVLNCFSYTGAFGVQAVLGGAKQAYNVDISEKALTGAKKNAALNGIDPDRFPVVKGDVFDFLRREERLYDVVVLDPPKFAASKGELPGALRGYKDINLNALKRLSAGGFLMTFSCSGLVTEDLFQKVVFGAATDAGRAVQIVLRLHADADHPVNLAHREGEYLKGLLLRVP
jgi:23S rRNA (cytosine1962-C5)-methyltransferase